MNIYRYWLRVKENYPLAVGACVAHFKKKYKTDWKKEFKRPDRIVEWFDLYNIRIETYRFQEGYEKKEFQNIYDSYYKYWLLAAELEIKSTFRFSDREPALYDAIEIGMRCLEQRTNHYKRQQQQTVDSRQ